ncbi:hypothetical protein [Roseateles violae]|uniref:Cell envelope biogenesis protein TolA n=1 Tax=Roseateles violae TaxID=3058042 RepID=A0ABT8DLA6_9BURK|nr:hypothetical protein [Pelomonas sp. PFR6]MDN3919194.1 hypothetical protein [Pelomonas sp. PFR6]
MNTSAKTHPLKASLIVAALLAMPLASQAAAMNKSEYQAAKSRISTEYDNAKSACGNLAGNAKDICVEEAKAHEKVAKAELEYNYTGKPADWTKLQKTKAETAYEVAKERCDDKSGNDKDVCLKEAKAAETKALADAKMNKKVGEAKHDAAEDKRDAEYKVQVEKCDALAGDAKSNCVATAKANFGKS